MRNILRGIAKFLGRPFTAYLDRRFTRFETFTKEQFDDLRGQLYTDAETTSELLAFHGRMLAQLEERLRELQASAGLPLDVR